jgi:glycosyltransferase involved in cell wall biosynthesis
MSIGHYRREPMSLVLKHFGDDLKIFAGRFATDRSIRTLGPSELPIRTLPTYSLGNRLFIQIVPLISYLKVPVLVADLNPRVVHLWPILVARRVLGKPSILWGAAWPRKGPDSSTTRLRLAMVKLASSVIIYTDQQARELQSVLPDCKITAAPNSLYRASQCGFEPHTARGKFVYVGRIVHEKKIALLIQAFARWPKRFKDISLIIVGDGPALDEMRALAVQLDVSQRVDFLGHVDDVEALKKIYSSCIGSISPGYVGLSATQSFSFGVPMAVADSEPHSPEIEAVKPGFNACMFPSNSIPGLAAVMQQMVIDRDHWHQMGIAIAEDCRRTYSAEAMATGIIGAVNSEIGNSCAVR